MSTYNFTLSPFGRVGADNIIKQGTVYSLEMLLGSGYFHDDKINGQKRTNSKNVNFYVTANVLIEVWLLTDAIANRAV